MVNTFDNLTISLIKEDLVLTKLTNTFIIKKINNECYVLINGIIAPYRLFTMCLLRYGLWHIRFSKMDWFLINRDLAELWTYLDIMPTEASFDIEKKDVKVAPIRWLKQAIMLIDFDKTTKEYFSVRAGKILNRDIDKFEALLKFSEEQYMALAK